MGTLTFAKVAALNECSNLSLLNMQESRRIVSCVSYKNAKGMVWAEGIAFLIPTVDDGTVDRSCVILWCPALVMQNAPISALLETSFRVR